MNAQVTGVAHSFFQSQNFNTVTMDSQKEVWKDIPGYEGHYQVSSFGNVKSLERKVKRSNHLLIKNERILKQSISNGYYSLNLAKNKISKSYKVHQLIAMAFLNHTPNGHSVVIDHIDRNKLNNNLSNIRLVSQRDNCKNYDREKTSKYIGVSYDKKVGKWKAQIHHKKQICIGGFKNEHEAYLAYQKALKQVSKCEEITKVKHKTSSKYKGVSFCKQTKKWRSAIIINRKSKHLGRFKTEYEAHLAYQNKLKELT